MRRRILTGLAVAVLSLLLVVPAWLVGTSSGLRQLLQVAQSRLPLEIEAPAGSLWGGLEFAALSYRSESLRLSVENASLKFRWACALRSVLCLDSAVISAVTVELRGEPDADSKPLAAPLPWSPIAVNVGRLKLAELAVITAAGSTTFFDLVLSGELDGRRALLERLDGRQQFGSWEGGALLSRDGSWEMEFTLEPDPAELAEIPLQLPQRWSLSASGDLSQLEADLRGLSDSRGAAQPALQLTLGLPSAGAALRASGSLAGLTSLLPQLAAQDRVSFAGPLQFDIRQPAGGATIALRQRLGGFAPDPLWLDVELVQREAQWELTRGTLGDKSRPALSAQGMLGALDSLAPRLQILLRDFTPPLGTELPSLTISGSLAAALELDDPLGSWAVENLDLAVREKQGERTGDWLLQGQLQASDQLFLPQGQLTGRRDALPFSYERPMGAAAVAWLRLPEGLPGDGVEISGLSARIAPGTQTALSLRSEGDIRGDFDLRLQATDRGVNFELEPFVFYALDQAISSDGPLAGAWLRDESLLELGEFCINWRGSKACADGARLGESGNLDLAVTLDEQYQAAAAGKPYFLEAAGNGRLSLRWVDAGLEEALLKLDLDTLSIDPFMEEGTAAPISWETARVSGSFQPGSLGLDLALESERLGIIEADLREDAGGLAGNVRAQGVNLSALDDLLPEWSLRSGAIQADLQLSGLRSAPIVTGTLTVDGASARVPQLDSALSAVNLRVDASNDRYTLGGSARLGDGPLNIQGLCCDDGVFRASITGERNRLRLPVGLDALVSPELDIQLGRQSLAVDGLITVHDGVLEHAGPSEGGVPLSNDVRRLDMPEAPPQRFDFSADVRALIEPGFTLRSRELEATLSGDLRASLRPERPVAVFGDLQVLGGELRAYGQVLRLTEGSVGFVGDPLNPALNLSAERRIRAEDLRVGFNVRGTLETPTFDIFSDPVRSERDTLSYLLRGRGPDAGTSVDGTAMALSLGASAINQSGALESLNAIPGLSGVTLGAEGSDEDMAATISAYVGERLYLSYGVGIYEPVNALTARLYLQSRLWLEVVSRLESSFDLYYRFDIE